MIEYAPILIPTLNRFEHFKRCIESLLECEGCSRSDLFIALDYPSKESHWDGFNKIKEFVKGVQGFKSVNIIHRERNFGAHNNIFDAYKTIFQNYDRVILSEDDNVFSKDFLYFININLEKYKYETSVFSVCGYNYPVRMQDLYDKKIYFWGGFSAWGVGLWRDKFLKIDWSKEAIETTTKTFLKSLNKVKQLDDKANRFVPALINMVKNGVIHGDTYVCLHQFLNNMVSVFPLTSRVRNFGHDGSGVNCGDRDNNIYSKQEIYSGKSDYEITEPVFHDPLINNILKEYFRNPLKERIKVLIKLIFFNMKNNFGR